MFVKVNSYVFFKSFLNNKCLECTVLNFSTNDVKRQLAKTSYPFLKKDKSFIDDATKVYEAYDFPYVVVFILFFCKFFYVTNSYSVFSEEVIVGFGLISFFLLGVRILKRELDFGFYTQKEQIMKYELSLKIQIMLKNEALIVFSQKELFPVMLLQRELRIMLYHVRRMSFYKFFYLFRSSQRSVFFLQMIMRNSLTNFFSFLRVHANPLLTMDSITPLRYNTLLEYYRTTFLPLLNVYGSIFLDTTTGTFLRPNDNGVLLLFLQNLDGLKFKNNRKLTYLVSCRLSRLLLSASKRELYRFVCVELKMVNINVF